MPDDKLPSMGDFTEDPSELPSVEDFITEDKIEEELPSVDEYIVDIKEEVEHKESDLPSVEDKIVDENLPTIEDYIEEEEKVEEEIETTGGISVQEYSPDMQFRDYEFIDIIKRPEWKELVGLVNEVRDNIPDIPEIKYYDDDLEKISETIEELRSEIPVVPEVKYYDEEIDQVKQTISDLPEVKYYDQEVSNLEESFSELKEFVSSIPNYDDELNSLRDKFNYDIQNVSESIEVKDFEKKVDIDNLKTDLKETSEKIYEELKKSSNQIHEYRLHLKDDDRKLKKQILGQYNLLKENIEKKVKEFNTKNIESQNVITGSLKEYFDELQEKISSIPEVRYYDEQIEELNNKFDIGIKEIREIVDQIKETQKQDLQENLLTEPPETDNEDPLTPLDQKFVTYEKLQENYQLFVNRVQQQLASFGGGGETKLQYLDDIVGVATNLSAYNGYVLKVDTSLDAPYKFKFAEESGSSNTGYANTAGISTYAVTAGIATYAETTGIATYATTAGIATDATNAGYAKTAGISTTSQGLSGTPSITVQDVTGVGATFTGNVTIGGTLTYEDVTNIDVVGLITARSGIDFGSPSVVRVPPIVTLPVNVAPTPVTS